MSIARTGGDGSGIRYPLPMIVELVILRAKDGTADQMRAGLQAARAVISQAQGYRGSTFQQGIEDPQRFALRIEWDSVEAHTEGFRGGPSSRSGAATGRSTWRAPRTCSTSRSSPARERRGAP